MFVGQLVYFALSFALLRLISGKRWSLSQSSLTGLVYYDVEEEALRSRVLQRGEERRRGHRAKRRALNIDSPDQQILQIELSPFTVKQWTFFREYDSVVAMLALMMMHGCISLFLPTLFTNSNLMTKPFAVLAIVVTLFTLLKIEFMSIHTLKWERWFLALVFMMGALVSFALLSVAEPTWFCFDLEQATADLNQKLDKIVHDIHTQAPSGTKATSYTNMLNSVRLEGQHLKIVLSIIAGIISCAVLNPAIRCTRSSQLMLSSTLGLSISLRCPVWFGTVHNAQDILLLCNCILWIAPLNFIADERLNSSQIWCALMLGMSQIVLFRPLMQGYLNTGLLAWYDTVQLHQGDQNSDAAMTITAHHVSKCWFLLCKVAIQALLLSACSLAFGILLLLAYAEKERYLYDISGFLCWWTCCTWTMYTVGTKALFRMGMMHI